MSETRQFLRHATATIAYRGAKVLRGAPPEFAHYKAGPSTRTPLEILSHIGDLLEVAAARLRGPTQWREAPLETWERQTARFHAALASIDAALAADAHRSTLTSGTRVRSRTRSRTSDSSRCCGACSVRP
jgi:hypothetical protein